jgi:hypothetical protein
LALLCFTKAFGIVFLGNERSQLPKDIKEASFIKLFPLYLIATFIILIGLFPDLFLGFLNYPLGLLTGTLPADRFAFQGSMGYIMQQISWAAWGLILLILFVFGIRKMVIRSRKNATLPTWGCAYLAPTAKLQYTAGSFVRTYSKLYGAVLLSFRKEKEIKGIFPKHAYYQSLPYDKIEKWIIDKPIKSYKSLMGKFLFLQNGRLQIYILYGIIFIILVISIPLLYEKMNIFIDILKKL